MAGIIKRTGVVAWFIGIAALIGLTVWSGADLVGQALASVGWGILLVVMVRAVTIAVAGAGSWLLFPPLRFSVASKRGRRRLNEDDVT